MFLYILESGLFSSLLSGATSILALAIILFPLAVFALIFSALATLVSLPYFLVVALPLSLSLYKRDQDNPVVWMGSFLLMASTYGFILGWCSGSPSVGHYGVIPGHSVDHSLASAFRASVVLAGHGCLTGWFMWGKLFDERFRALNNGKIDKHKADK